MTIKDRNDSFEDPGRRGRRCPEEPHTNLFTDLSIIGEIQLELQLGSVVFQKPLLLRHFAYQFIQ